MPLLQPATRRRFLSQGCCAAAASTVFSGFGGFGLINALAQQTAPDYKALVGIFMFGGNDGNNLLVPLGAQDYGAYSSARGPLTLAQGALLPIQPVTAPQPFGLHPKLAEIRALFDQGKAALLCNVGLLVRPLSRTEYLGRTAPLPVNLFSHADQQAQWQTSLPNGLGNSGWAGRTADQVQASSTGFPTIVTVAGNNIFCVGNQTRPASFVPGSSAVFQGFDSSAVAQARLSAMQQLLSFDSGISLVQSASGITGNAFKYGQLLTDALAGAAKLQTVFPKTSLGAQLQEVANIIQVRAALGMKRQIFFCALSGFDTHSNQLPDQDQLFSELSPALGAFYQATVEMGVAPAVTSFTLSDFGRTLKPASGLGSDHAWGNHHMIVGGAVQGGDLYGQFPTMALGGPNDAGSEGRWIPTTSLDQYAATLASWFGVTPASLGAVFPNLGNFAAPTLKFLG